MTVQGSAANMEKLFRGDLLEHVGTALVRRRILRIRICRRLVRVRTLPRSPSRQVSDFQRLLQRKIQSCLPRDLPFLPLVQTPPTPPPPPPTPPPAAAPIAAPFPPPAPAPISAPRAAPPPIVSALRFPRDAPVCFTSLLATLYVLP